MKRTLDVTRSWFVPALAAFGLLVAYATPALADDDDDVVPGEVAVKLTPGFTIQEFAARYGTPILEAIPATRTYLVRVTVGDEEEFVDILRGDPDVADAEPNFTGRDVNPDPGTQSIFVSSDLDAYVNQAPIDLIRADQANALSTGAGVTVAVIDSGIDVDHPQFAQRLAPGGRSFFGDPTDLADVGDRRDNDGDGLIDEAVGHGTLAAGLVVRVAPDALILPLRVMDSDGFTSTFDMANAVYYGMEQGAQVLNISMGSTRDTFVMFDAITEAQRRGVVVVASAGNEDTSSPVRFPAGYSDLGVVAVAATTLEDRRADFSNFGPHISLSAPGVDLTSTVPGSRYGRASGTSFAAPLVAGGAALMFELDPEAHSAAISARLIRTADRISPLNPGYERFLGRGRLNLFNAVSGQWTAPPAPPRTPSRPPRPIGP